MAFSLELFILRKPGKCANGNERDGGTTFHAVLGQRGRPGLVALCGSEPAHEWAGHEGASVTCERCLKRLLLVPLDTPAPTVDL